MHKFGEHSNGVWLSWALDAKRAQQWVLASQNHPTLCLLPRSQPCSVGACTSSSCQFVSSHTTCLDKLHQLLWFHEALAVMVRCMHPHADLPPPKFILPFGGLYQQCSGYNPAPLTFGPVLFPELSTTNHLSPERRYQDLSCCWVHNCKHYCVYWYTWPSQR